MQTFMKKNFLFISLLLSLLLVACNGGGTSSETNSSSSSIDSQETSSSSEQLISSEEDISSDIESISSDASVEEISSSEEISSIDNTLSDEDLFALIETGIASKDKIASGNLVYNDGNSIKDVTYEFGTDQYGNFAIYTYEGYKEYYGYDSTSYYGIIVAGENVSSITNYVEDNIYGPNINPYSYKENFYGAEDLISMLVNLAKENKNYDFTNNSTKESYNFSVGRVLSNGFVTSLYINNVSFTIEDGCIKTLDVTIDKYNDIVADFEFDGVYYINDGAKIVKTYTISYTQLLAPKLTTNEIDIESYYFNEFTLVNDNDEVITSDLVATVDVEKPLSIKDYSPSSASEAVDTLEFVSLSDDLKYTSDYKNGSLNLLFKTIGTFDVQIKSKRVTMDLTLTVKNVVPNEVSLTYYVERGDSYNSVYVDSEQDSFDVYNNSTIYLDGGFYPFNANQDYTIELVDASENMKLEKTTIQTSDLGESKKEVYKLTTSEVGSYDIKIASLEYPDVSRTITMNVIAEPSIDDLVKERYVSLQRGYIAVDIEFTPNEDDSTKGKVNISDSYGINGTYSYTYDSSTREFTINVTGASLFFDDTFTLFYQYNSGTYTLMAVNPVNMLKNCDWVFRNAKGNAITMNFDKEEQSGTITVSKIVNYVSQYTETYEFTYEYVENSDGGFTLTIDEDCINSMLESTHISSFSNTLTVNSAFSRIEGSATIDEQELSVSCSRSY